MTKLDPNFTCLTLLSANVWFVQFNTMVKHLKKLTNF